MDGFYNVPGGLLRHLAKSPMATGILSSAFLRRFKRATCALHPADSLGTLCLRGSRDVSTTLRLPLLSRVPRHFVPAGQS